MSDFITYDHGGVADFASDVGARSAQLMEIHDDILHRQGGGRWANIVELNPLLHYLDIVRAPLLGAHQELRHWAVVLALTIVGWLLAAFAMRQYRARVPYWV